MMGVLYDVETYTINYHLKKVFADSELENTASFRIASLKATLTGWSSNWNRKMRIKNRDLNDKAWEKIKDYNKDELSQGRRIKP